MRVHLRAGPPRYLAVVCSELLPDLPFAKSWTTPGSSFPCFLFERLGFAVCHWEERPTSNTKTCRDSAGSSFVCFGFPCLFVVCCLAWLGFSLVFAFPDRLLSLCCLLASHDSHLFRHFAVFRFRSPEIPPPRQTLPTPELPDSRPASASGSSRSPFAVAVRRSRVLYPYGALSCLVLSINLIHCGNEFLPLR